MKGRVGLKQLAVDCIIGDLDGERIKERRIFLSLSWELSFDRVAASDELADTVDYTAVAAFCRAIASEGKFRMIEALAATILSRLLEKFRFSSLQVTLFKPSVLEGCEGAFVEVEGGISP